MTETPITRNTDLAMFVLGARTRAGMTVHQLAVASGAREEDIIAVEQGQDDLTVDLLMDLFAAMGASLYARQPSATDTPLARPEPEPEPEVQPEPASEPVEFPVQMWVPGQRRAFLLRSHLELGHALRMARVRTGQTQDTAARGMQMAGPTVNKHEKGAGMIVEMLFRYANYYGVEFVIGPHPEDTTEQ